MTTKCMVGTYRNVAPEFDRLIMHKHKHNNTDDDNSPDSFRELSVQLKD